MYPKNAASPPVIAVGQVILIADGSVVTADASARVKIGTGDWGASAGTLACDSTSGCWAYTPSQAETNAESFIVAVYKASCIGCQVTVVTTASATAGKAYVSNIDNDAITADVIADNAIGAAQIASNALQAAKFDSGCLTSAKFAAGFLTSTGFASGSITADAIASNAITAAKIATDAIDADALAADAIAEINATVDTALGDYDAPTKAEMDSAFTEIKGATCSSGTDTLEAIRDRGDAAWITATGFSTHDAASVVTAMGTGDFLTAIPWNSAWDVEVQSECADALNAYDPPTKAELDSAFTEIKGATWASGTDTLEAIRDRGDSAWITATGFMPSSEDGSSFTAVPWNAAWDAEVQSECTDALNAYDPPTKAELDSGFTEIKGATWDSGTDTLEAIRNAEGSTYDIVNSGTHGNAALKTLIDAVPTAAENAEATLKLDASEVESDVDAGTHSLLTIVLATLESSVSGTTWSIKKTTGDAFTSKTLTADETGEAVTIIGVT